MRKADISGIVGLIFSAFVMEQSWQMPTQTITEGIPLTRWPGLFPFWAGLFMAFFSILLIVNSLRRPADNERRTITILPRGQTLIAIVLFTASLAAYIFLLDILGYLVDTILFNVFLMRCVMRAKWNLSLWVPMLAAVSFYVIFQVMLGVSLPQNMLGF